MWESSHHGFRYFADYFMKYYELIHLAHYYIQCVADYLTVTFNDDLYGSMNILYCCKDFISQVNSHLGTQNVKV